MSKERILLVDDDPVVRRVLRFALEAGGYEVDTCADGVAALEAIRARAPDVLVSDIEMPRMNGRELCMAIEREFPARRFRMFVATSLPARELREWSAGVAGLVFLEKPISARKLLAEIGATLPGKGQTGPGEA